MREQAVEVLRVVDELPRVRNQRKQEVIDLVLGLHMLTTEQVRIMACYELVQIVQLHVIGCKRNNVDIPGRPTFL